MKKVKMLWMPVLLGALLMATLFGVAGAGPNARPEASPALVDYMSSAHHCIPQNDDDDWDFTGSNVGCASGVCTFICPIRPPHEGLIRAQRLATYAYDNDAVGGEEVCIWLEHVYPKTGTNTDRLSNECTSTSPTDPEVYAYNPANFKVSVLQDLFVWATVTAGEKLYGFKVKYEPL